MYLEQNLLCFPVQVSLNWVIMGVIAIESISIMLVFQSFVWVVTIFAKKLRNFLLEAVHALNTFYKSLPFKKERERERERERKKKNGRCVTKVLLKENWEWGEGVYIGFATSEMRKILSVLDLVVCYYWSLEAFGVWTIVEKCRILCQKKKKNYIYIWNGLL